MSKTLHNSDASGTRKNVPDVVFFGDEDTWKLICKASSKEEGWMKSTKALQVEGVGCFVQVTTQQENEEIIEVGMDDNEELSGTTMKNGNYSITDSIAWAPGIRIEETGEGATVSRKLVAI